jgi:carbonic anhydrase/acetyltransferase-like protein (isoleucine patch superfamily)
MKRVIKLTDHNGNAVLIGVESIIHARKLQQGDFIGMTKIESRAAMVTSNIVKETVEEIYLIINS